MLGRLMLAALLGAGPAAARTLTVGPGQAFAGPGDAARAVADGDTVLIQPGEYFQCAIWTRDHLTIAGAGPGVVVSDATCQGKALFVVAGNDTTIRDLTLTRARVPDGNGAGVRLEGQGLTLERVQFVNDEVGVLAGSGGPGALRISDCRFEAGGVGGDRPLAAVLAGPLALLRIERSQFLGVKGGQVTTSAVRTELIGNAVAAGAGDAPSVAVAASGGVLLMEDNTLAVGPGLPRRAAAIWATDDAAPVLRRNRLDNQTGQSLALLLDWTGGTPVLEGNTVGRGDSLVSTSGIWRHRASVAYHGTKDGLRGMARQAKRGVYGLLGVVKHLVLALLLALPCRAGAAAFDTFQVIEWQDCTPAQSAGLQALGFTALKLRGTGGQIDPAELAARIASGLPWYVENIATDFLAPYHRYIPGHPVTWLFDQAKARRRADPADGGIFVRQPGLSDPAWLGAVSARLEQVVRTQALYRPLFYNLADEAGIGDLVAFWDADTGPTSLAAMRQWLRTQYRDLDALNAQWDTGFTGWDEVVPELTDAAMRRTDDNYSSWADFKAWMDVAFARAVRSGTDAVHRGDPAALAGLEGAQIPGWGGYDYSLLAPAVDVLETYDYGNALELAHAFNPGAVMLRTSFGSGPREHHAAWRHLLRGGRGMIVWDERDDVVQADGSPGPRGRDIAALLAEMRPVAGEIMASVPAPDPVAVLISQASFRTRWMLDQRPRGPAWSERDAGREYEDNAWRAGRRQALQRLGQLAVQPRLLSSAMLEGGALRQDGLRVLILPQCIALSDAEVAEVAAFAQAGGTVLADTPPGVFDGHSRRRAAPVLQGVVRLPEAMMLDGAPLGTETLVQVASLLRDAGVVPRVSLRGPDGQVATGVDAQWLRNGDRLLLAVQTVAPWSGPGQVTLVFPAPVMAGDLRAAGPGRAASQITIGLDPIAPTLLRVSR